MSEIIEAKSSHHYKTSPDIIFNAWLDPSLVGKWMFGPNIRDEEVVSIEIDPKVGGEFSFLVNRQNTIIDHVGKYLRIEKPNHLEFNWGVKGMNDSSRVIIKISPTPDGCELNLTHELKPAWIDYLERAKEGWKLMLVKLGEIV